MEEMNRLPFEQERRGPGGQAQGPQWEAPRVEPFPARKRELGFGIGALLCGLLGANAVLFGSFSLEFALFCLMSLGLGVWYLHRSGKRLTLYPAALLILCGIIALGFARSDDAFVKFVMVCFLLVGGNLALCLMAGQNRRDAAHFATLMDASRALFTLGMGQLPPALSGLRNACRTDSPAGKNTGAVLLGIGIAVPVLAVMIPLLISADAAFDSLVALLPRINLVELLFTLVWGAFAACVLYTRGVALNHAEKAQPAESKRRALPALTVNVVLGAVCAVFAVYLFSQLAYVTGGLAGILPEGYTLAQYARRGFFEMAFLCAMNLAIIALSVGFVRNTGKAPLSTRLLCLFIGVMTLFFVITASAKMGMYIASYGMTRLRVLTEVIMVFLGIATVVVCLWLFLPKLPYMKVILLTALVMGAVVFWADVDSVVADYNVTAYQTGRLSHVDVTYLFRLSDGAWPHIARLTQDGNEAVRNHAAAVFQDKSPRWEDLRDWNWASYRAWLAIQEQGK